MRSAFDEDKGPSGDVISKLSADNLEMLGNKDKSELDELKRKYNI